MDKFSKWLDEEIEKLEAERTESNLFTCGKYAEAIRIRLTKNGMDDEAEKIAGEICDRYCRFPEAYPENENDRMIEEKCNKCPLVRLMK